MDFLPLGYVIDPNKRVFWLYILSSLVIAFIYLAINKRERRVNLSRKLWLHPSSILDYKYFFVNYLLKILVIVPLIFGAKEVALFTNRGLYDLFGFNLIRGVSYEVVITFYTVTLFIVSDFTRYWTHRFLHTIPLLWEFHKVHHSARVLNPLTFYRIHPVENLLFGLRYALSIGFVTGVFIYFFGAMVGVLDILGANFLIFIFSLFGSNLRHTHIKFKYPTVLERVFISPYQHQIHHSNRHFDKNYGGYLAIWDWVFGSLELSKNVKTMKFGLRGDNDYSSIFKLLVKPFTGLKRRRVI